MEEIFKAMEAWFRQHPPNLGEEASVLDALFWLYTEHNNMDNKAILEQFATLREHLSLPPQKYDEVFYIVSNLCLEHAKQAFRSGFCLAVTLMQEIKNKGAPIGAPGKAGEFFFVLCDIGDKRKILFSVDE